MADSKFVDDEKVMAKGQVTIPKNVRTVLGVEPGDRVTFIVEGKDVRVMNSFDYAVQLFQDQMKGEVPAVGISSEDEVADWITKSRRR